MDAQYLYILLPALFLIEAAFVGFAGVQFNTNVSFRERLGGVLGSLYQNPAGVVALVIVWLLLTAAIFWYEFFIGLVVLYLVLFSLGRLAAGVGLVAFAALVVATPVVCAWLLLRIGRQYRRPRDLGPSPAGLVRVERGRPAMPRA